MDLSLILGDKLTLFGSFAYHRADYYAQADWNLITMFAHPISYTHEANAAGFVLSAELEYFLTGSWSLKAGIDYQRWYTGAGIDRTFLASGLGRRDSSQGSELELPGPFCRDEPKLLTGSCVKKAPLSRGLFACKTNLRGYCYCTVNGMVLELRVPPTVVTSTPRL